ncbi:bifunctional riboflavin kinase/FAD synthetase [Sulfurovum sp. zt1-1]|uniref:Bifunctional riboflavin kinase/FMN adenylyltransferase n=1 Tax=Sulfurovum zhangzhouensis TaxID=3019067 RepID=A0ABT7R0T4_9BACT|nr:bifunctional riboflavin kinase/FAD synthetase [Sulfurovum zhangzhouensis]MDM5272686.1 bifunctional riboflavin kinase/FAD synthetase [Sulfurovum zhangzhouensis]
MSLTNQIKSIAIGSFDGFHLGHQVLVAQAEAIVIIERNGGYLTPGYKRSYYTDKICCFYHFDKIKGLTPKAFVARLLEDFPLLEKIVVGYDFLFGQGKIGNAALLKELFDGEVTIIDQVCYEGIPVHSRTIKEYLREGRVKMANELLGRCYEIEGEVIRGQGLGKESFVPTLNLSVDHYQLPLEGVYATRTKLGDTWYDSVSFLGNRVTTDGNFAVETHILDHVIDNIHDIVSLKFLDLIRVNKKFDSFEALKIQIEEDIKKAKELLG